jgi:hypothetical protein
MSLILEALRKLEREKQAPERGFLVMAHTPWGVGRRWSTLTVAGVLLVAAALASILTAIALRRGPAAGARAAVTSPHPVASTTPVAGVGSPAVSAASLAAIPASQPAPAAIPLALPAAGATAPASPPSPAIAPSSRPAPSPAPDLRLLAISEQDGQPVAIVNDRLVREGDSFDGIRILRIGAAEVEVEVQGKKRVLTFQ